MRRSIHPAMSGTKLVEIAPEPPGEGVVEYLEVLLERARAGEISAIAAATVYRDGSTGSGYSVLPNTSTMLGAIERLKYKILDGD